MDISIRRPAAGFKPRTCRNSHSLPFSFLGLSFPSMCLAMHHPMATPAARPQKATNRVNISHSPFRRVSICACGSLLPEELLLPEPGELLRQERVALLHVLDDPGT